MSTAVSPTFPTAEHVSDPQLSWTSSLSTPRNIMSESCSTPVTTTFSCRITPQKVCVFPVDQDHRMLIPFVEVLIQNTTFGGTQGFTRKPATPWTDDEGQFAGIVHQERNWTYILVSGAGQIVPADQPERVSPHLGTQCDIPRD